MLVCHCRQVNDRAIEQSMAAGARSIHEVAERCGAGSRCGGCWPTIHELLAAVKDSARAARGPVTSPT